MQLLWSDEHCRAILPDLMSEILVLLNWVLISIYVSELKLATFSCQVDGMIVTIWHYQFFNNLQSDCQYAPNTVQHYCSCYFPYWTVRLQSPCGRSDGGLVILRTSELAYSELCLFVYFWHLFINCVKLYSTLTIGRPAIHAVWGGSHYYLCASNR